MSEAKFGRMEALSRVSMCSSEPRSVEALERVDSRGSVLMPNRSWSNWHVATAAEAIAAAQFARFGYDVSVQYGANQPEYDLMIAEGARILKISVKGSADGGWGLSQSQLAKLRNANYHGAADAWLARHKPLTALCLVQFRDVADESMPRVYLAWPKDICERLKIAAGGRGDTILWENYKRGPRAAGAGTVEQLPESWRMTRSRVKQLLTENDVPRSN